VGGVIPRNPLTTKKDFGDIPYGAGYGFMYEIVTSASFAIFNYTT